MVQASNQKQEMPEHYQHGHRGGLEDEKSSQNQDLGHGNEQMAQVSSQGGNCSTPMFGSSGNEQSGAGNNIDRNFD